ncbi:unnamed protein product [marine sediment metagenome]|uniref:Uncharacterized protein n=1 Tax=marine sediment metagenome TaxID=412755 RepID=X1LUR5_9ZZZZ
MEGLAKKIEQIFTQYFGDCVGNRINQWSFGTFKNIVLSEIRNYKPGNVKDEVKKDNGVSK